MRVCVCVCTHVTVRTYFSSQYLNRACEIRPEVPRNVTINTFKRYNEEYNTMDVCNEKYNAIGVTRNAT